MVRSTCRAAWRDLEKLFPLASSSVAGLVSSVSSPLRRLPGRCPRGAAREPRAQRRGGNLLKARVDQEPALALPRTLGLPSPWVSLAPSRPGPCLHLPPACLQGPPLPPPSPVLLQAGSGFHPPRLRQATWLHTPQPPWLREALCSLWAADVLQGDGTCGERTRSRPRGAALGHGTRRRPRMKLERALMPHAEQARRGGTT